MGGGTGYGYEESKEIKEMYKKYHLLQKTNLGIGLAGLILIIGATFPINEKGLKRRIAQGSLGAAATLSAVSLSIYDKNKYRNGEL